MLASGLRSWRVELSNLHSEDSPSRPAKFEIKIRASHGSDPVWFEHDANYTYSNPFGGTRNPIRQNPNPARILLDQT